MWDLPCCFVSVATVSKCLGLGFPPAAVKGLQAGLLPVQTDVPGEMLPGKPSHPVTLGCCTWCCVHLQPSVEVSVLCDVAPLRWGDLVACCVGHCFRVTTLLAAWILFL